MGAEVLGVVVNDVAPDRMAEGFDVSFAHLGGGKSAINPKSAETRVDKLRSNP